MAKLYRCGKPQEMLSIEPSSQAIITDEGIRYRPVVHVWDDSKTKSDDTIITPFMLTRLRDTLEAANAIGMHEAAKWIDEGRPSLPQVGP